MRSLSKNSRRLQVEQLEHRCTPGSVLDLVGPPLLAPLGQSLVFLEATETAVATGALVSPQDNTILASPVAAGEQVPFKGSLEGVDIATAVTPPFVSTQVTATGNASHLGNFTFTELVTVDTRTRIGTGTFLLTAANGDTVFGTSSGQATLIAPTVLTIKENMVITGGTGRFAGATGTFTVTRLKDTITGVTTGSFTGTISAPGASN